MRIRKLGLIITIGVLAVAAAARVAAAPSIALARVALVTCGAMFLAGCLWRMAHSDRWPGGPAE